MAADNHTLIIITPGFAKDEQDSTCLPLQQQLILSFREVHPALNIVILSLHYPLHTQPYQWHGIKVIPFDGRGKGGLSKWLLRKKLLKTLDGIHTQSPITSLLSFWCGEAAAIAKSYADKYNITHRCWILGQDAKAGNPFVKRMKPKAGELVALSDFLQREFERNHGVKPASVIPAGINPRLFSPRPQRDIDILAAGSLIPLKQFDVFIDIVARVRTVLPGVKVVLAGDGPERSALQASIKQLGLKETISMPGKLDYETLTSLMGRCSIFLHPSMYEGFSGVCLEALAAGAHVISFCRAMDAPIDQWHIVTSPEEMYNHVLDILGSSQTTFRTVQPYPINHIAERFLMLLHPGAFRHSEISPAGCTGQTSFERTPVSF